MLDFPTPPSLDDMEWGKKVDVVLSKAPRKTFLGYEIPGEK